MLSLLHQFPSEYVTLNHKQVGDYNSKRALYEFCLCLPWYLFMSCWCFSGNLCAFVSFIFIKSTYKNDLTDLLFNVCTHCMSSREDSSLLREIRKPVSSYIIDVCSSFSARDCNARFSQIFEKRTFGYLNCNQEEESLFMTLRTFDSFVAHARILWLFKVTKF